MYLMCDLARVSVVERTECAVFIGAVLDSVVNVMNDEPLKAGIEYHGYLSSSFL